MRKSIFLAALICLAVIGVAMAQRSVSFRRNVGRGMKVEIDSVMYRSDVCRVYARLVGVPNTSGCVDEVLLNCDKRQFKATDIDPIYFTRPFQWEEEPDMPVEIDFPPFNAGNDTIAMTVVTPGGRYSAKYFRPAK